jgi:hypothetical protein
VIPARAKAAAVLSLVIWTGVLTMGRLIGYYEGGKSQQRGASVARMVLPE